MPKYEIATTMIVRPLLTIEADTKEEAVQKLHEQAFDKEEFKETALPASNIDAEEMWEDGNRIEDPSKWL